MRPPTGHGLRASRSLHRAAGTGNPAASFRAVRYSKYSFQNCGVTRSLPNSCWHSWRTVGKAFSTAFSRVLFSTVHFASSPTGLASVALNATWASSAI
ncbi:hypothetical protein G6F57_011076 [Rhizopus arrhizus]|nr:hypothetical protein G6F65_009616 [Rhizopus arrhizus]KAG1472284.1 hypothetical protein G6F57_011076 [Rhizopus arrhizus]